MLNKTLPDFALPATGNRVFRLSASQGKLPLIYFYPNDNRCITVDQQLRSLYFVPTLK